MPQTPPIVQRVVRAAIGACGFCILSSPVAAAFDARPPQWPFYLVVAFLLLVVIGLLFDWLIEGDTRDTADDVDVAPAASARLTSTGHHHPA